MITDEPQVIYAQNFRSVSGFDERHVFTSYWELFSLFCLSFEHFPPARGSQIFLRAWSTLARFTTSTATISLTDIHQLLVHDNLNIPDSNRGCRVTADHHIISLSRDRGDLCPRAVSLFGWEADLHRRLCLVYFM